MSTMPALPVLTVLAAAAAAGLIEPRARGAVVS